MVFVLVEKVAPHSRWISRAAGVAAVAAGLWSLWATQPVVHAH
jgi:predicted metal-binding membrane protein